MRAHLIWGRKRPQDEAFGAEFARQFEMMSSPANAEVIIVVGGDGSMVENARQFHDFDVPIYGINRGTVGFLLNDHELGDDIVAAIQASVETQFPLLEATISFNNGDTTTVLAFNDIWTKSINQRGQSAKHRILIDGQDIMIGHRYSFFCGDGLIVCTPGGSTAYNRSAGGIILDVNAGDCMGLTPICAYVPDNFRPQVLQASSVIDIIMMEDDKRHHLVMADNQGFSDVSSVRVTMSDKRVKLLFRDSLSYTMKTNRLRFPWQEN